MREMWSEIRRLLVVCLEPPADVIAAAPALERLREALPETAITLWVRSVACADAAGLIGVRDCLVSPLEWSRPARLEAVVEGLRQFRFDGALFLTTRHSSPLPAAYLCYLAGIPIRIGQANLFGGGVLSAALARPAGVDGTAAGYQAMVDAAGLGGSVMETVARRAGVEVL